MTRLPGDFREQYMLYTQGLLQGLRLGDPLCLNEGRKRLHEIIEACNPLELHDVWTRILSITDEVVAKQDRKDGIR